MWRNSSSKIFWAHTSPGKCLDNIMELLWAVVSYRVWPRSRLGARRIHHAHDKLTYITDGGLLIDLRLKILKDSLVNHCVVWLEW